MKSQFTKFTHKTPHLGKKQHQLDLNLDMKQLVHQANPVLKGTRYIMAIWFEGPKWR